MRVLRHLCMIIFASAILSGCSTLNGIFGPSEKEIQTKVDLLETRVLTGYLDPVKALPQYEKIYNDNRSSPLAAASYADALRRAQKPAGAARILKPFVKDKSSDSLDDAIFMAYTRLLLDQNYAAEAQTRLQKRLRLPEDRLRGTASTAQLNNLLGIAYAAQNNNAAATQAFEKARKHWDGRPGVVEKNLARLKATK